MVIDFHTHVFPDALAPRAISSLAQRIGYAPETNGTVDGIISKMNDWGVDRAVVCNIATNPKQQDNVNSFAKKTASENKNLYCLGSVHPDSDTICETLCRIKDCGLPGIKIHPDYMGYEITDPKFEPIFSLCSQLDLFVITHAGFDVCSPKKIHATPEMIRKVSEKFPNLKLIAAHFGGNLMWNEVREHICGRNIWIDTSLAFAEGTESDTLKSILLAHSPDRILYGSDAPWCHSGKNIEFIKNMKLPQDSIDKIMYKNALELLEK